LSERDFSANEPGGFGTECDFFPAVSRAAGKLPASHPLKPTDALSEPKRTGANQWFANTLLSRLDDTRIGAIVIVMQRVHMDDMTGFVSVSRSCRSACRSSPCSYRCS
jgi:hypothetical protein